MKKLLTIIFIYIFTFQVSYAGAAEKRTIEEVVYKNVGKNLQYTVQKNFGAAANDFKYKATVPVSASALGSTAFTMIKYGLASAAVLALVEGVGWIIENGVVKKIDPTAPNTNNAPYIWSYGNAYNTDPEVVCKSLSGPEGDGTGSSPKYIGLEFVDANTYNCKIKQFNREVVNATITRIANPKYKPELGSPSNIPVSPDEMGNKILESPQAPQIVPDIYSPYNPVPRPSPAPDATESILNKADPIPKSPPVGDVSNKPNKDTDGDGKPDAYDPNLPSAGSEFKLPPFCTIAPTMCEWYAKYKEDSKNNDDHRVKEITFWSQVTDFFKDTIKDPEDTDIDVQNDDPPQLDTQILTASGECPPDFTYSFPLPLGGTYPISYSYATVCYWFSKLYFIVVTVASVISLRIVSGTDSKNNG
jgi:hypothetical protein